MGDGTTQDKTTPVYVMSGVVDISAAGSNTCAIKKTDNTLRCWGNNSFGQLGDVTYESSSTPVYIMDGVSKVAVGGRHVFLGGFGQLMGFGHTCAIKLDGTLWCWGNNLEGQIGEGSYQNKATLVFIMSEVSQVFASWVNTCAVKIDGSLWCWGDNTDGQLGYGIPGRNHPVRVLAGSGGG